MEKKNRVEDRWNDWLRKHPHPGFESRRYDDRKLEAIIRMKKEFEKLPHKTREEVATMRRLEAEAEKLRKPQRASKLERTLRESRNPIARFFAVLLETIRELANDRREKLGIEPEKPKEKRQQARREDFPDKQRRPQRRYPTWERQEKLIRTPTLPITHSRKRSF